jgi:hypothetical protein
MFPNDYEMVKIIMTEREHAARRSAPIVLNPRGGVRSRLSQAMANLKRQR